MVKYKKIKISLITLIMALGSMVSVSTMADTQLSEQEKSAHVTKTIARLKNEIAQPSVSKEHVRRVAAALKLVDGLATLMPNLKTAPIPGYCLYQGDNYLFNVISIAEKQDRIEAAIAYTKTVEYVDQKVTDYFQKTLKKLQSGINVPLPDYYHATRAGLKSIIESKTIRQSNYGTAGSGTYISSNNEGNPHPYGPYAFAIDESVLAGTEGAFFRGRGKWKDVYASLWIAVLKDITIAQDTVAFIDIDKNEDIHDIAYVKKLLEKQQLPIEVIDRKTAHEIAHIFDITTKKRELPSFSWEAYYGGEELPLNMYERDYVDGGRQLVSSISIASDTQSPAPQIPVQQDLMPSKESKFWD